MLHLFAYIPVDVYIWTVYTDNTWQGENVTFLLASQVNKHGPGETNKSIKSLHLGHYFTKITTGWKSYIKYQETALNLHKVYIYNKK